MATKPPMKTFASGSCIVAYIGPQVSTLSPKTPSLNISVSFEEALKLNLAIDECVRQLNKYKRNYRIGKNKGLNLRLHLQNPSITINECDLE
jgi:hypothetical protein